MAPRNDRLSAQDDCALGLFLFRLDVPCIILFTDERKDKTMKKALALVLSLILVFSMVSLVSAEEMKLSIR